MQLSSATLSQLSDALRLPATPGSFPIKLWQRLLNAGWATRHDVEDLLLAMDYRTRHVELDNLAREAGFPSRFVRDRPRFATAEFMAFESMEVADLVGFSIFLEQLGFACNPEPMVQALRAHVAGLKTMTLTEAEIFNFDKLRHRSRWSLQAHRADGFVAAEIGSYRASTQADLVSPEWQGHAGYRYRCLTHGRDIISLTITGPKWKRLVREEIECQLCGMQYTRGDPESALSHRREHARVVRLLSPTASRVMRDRLVLGIRAERVDIDSPLWMHREVYERALRFKRDFGYDFVQWPPVVSRGRLDPRWIGFLFADAVGVIDGAAAFQLVEGQWALGWVWIRPVRRRQGLLAARWVGFLQEFGDFEIEYPLSEAMRFFVNRYGTAAQRRTLAA